MIVQNVAILITDKARIVVFIPQSVAHLLAFFFFFSFYSTYVLSFMGVQWILFCCICVMSVCPIFQLLSSDQDRDNDCEINGHRCCICAAPERRCSGMRAKEMAV